VLKHPIDADMTSTSFLRAPHLAAAATGPRTAHVESSAQPLRHETGAGVVFGVTVLRVAAAPNVGRRFSPPSLETRAPTAPVSVSGEIAVIERGRSSLFGRLRRRAPRQSPSPSRSHPRLIDFPKRRLVPVHPISSRSKCNVADVPLRGVALYVCAVSGCRFGFEPIPADADACARRSLHRTCSLHRTRSMADRRVGHGGHRRRTVST
jgi:hypothetical protein